MGKNTKLAILIAPILAVLGYIAADYYAEYQAKETKIYQLVNEGVCDILNHQCVLKSGDFKVNVYDEKGVTIVNSTFPLDNATLFLVNNGVDRQDKGQVYPLTMKDNFYYWQSNTPLREMLETSGKKQKLRLIASIKGGKYLAEFYTN